MGPGSVAAPRREEAARCAASGARETSARESRILAIALRGGWGNWGLSANRSVTPGISTRGHFEMKRLSLFAWLAAIAALPFSQTALAQRAEYDALVATHANANGVPEALVHRVITRESRYQPRLVGRGGTIGLMQIKLATARSLAYTGTAEGLRDPNPNLTYAVKYLAGAYPPANGDHNRPMHYYPTGYYYQVPNHH